MQDSSLETVVFSNPRTAPTTASYNMPNDKRSDSYRFPRDCCSTPAAQIPQCIGICKAHPSLFGKFRVTIVPNGNVNRHPEVGPESKSPQLVLLKKHQNNFTTLVALCSSYPLIILSSFLPVYAGNSFGTCLFLGIDYPDD